MMIIATTGLQFSITGTRTVLVGAIAATLIQTANVSFDKLYILLTTIS